jgi:uncharacterized protein
LPFAFGKLPGGYGVGPTNQALLNYFKADQASRAVKARLDAVTCNVRTQEAKVAQLTKDRDDGQTKSVQLEAKAKELELDVQSREQRIQTLRDRQNNATNQKEYQALIIDINTQKVDKGKIEEQALAAMEASETQKKAQADLTLRLASETAKLAEMKSQIDAQVQALTAELKTHDGPIAAAAATVDSKLLDLYRRAADKYDGEGMAAIDRPNPREEEYLCTGCHTYLITDIYNKLRNKDVAVACVSCGRLLYIPEELTPDKAVKIKKPVGEKKPRAKKAKAASTQADDVGEESAEQAQ